MSHFQSTVREERLLELMCNQLQLSNLLSFTQQGKNFGKSIEALHVKIVDQRKELSLTVEGF